MPHSLADRLAQVLASRRCTVAYGVTGAAIGRFTAAAHDAGFRIVHPRHESGAAFMATEHSLVADEPTVVFTTSGPGFSNAITGLVAAAWEGAHVIAVVGGTPEERAGRFPFQATGPRQLDLSAWLPPDLPHLRAVVADGTDLAPLCAELDPMLASPGGSLTLILLPSDRQAIEAPHPPMPSLPRRLACSEEDVVRVAERLRGRRVLCWVGHGARHGRETVRGLVDALGAVVVVTPRGKGVFPESHPACLGVSGLGGARGVAERVLASKADVGLVLGARMSEFTSWWDPRLIPPEGLVHVGLEEPGDAFAPQTLWIRGDVGPVADALVERVDTQPVDVPPALPPEELAGTERGLHPGQVMSALQDAVVSQGVPVVSEAGNAFAWATRRLRFDTPTYRVSPDFGAMGQASAGVVGLALGRGGPAVAVLGDGAMLMNTEINTAVHEGARAVWVVLNDAAYGMIAHGMRAIGLDPIATTVPRVDFVAFARAQGADGVAVDHVDQLADALSVALEASGPFVVDVRIDPDISPPFGARNDALVRPEEATWRG